MAVITCPECGHHPVSDRAAACPTCGFPVAAADLGNTRGSEPPPSTAAQREELLSRYQATLRTGSADYPETSVIMGNKLLEGDVARFEELVNHLQGWCEELTLFSEARRRHIELIRRISTLRSLVFQLPTLDDESLLAISKIQTLRQLRIANNQGPTSPAGWLQLAKLSELEFLWIPGSSYLASDDDEEGRRVKEELRRRLPNTIFK